MNRSKRSTRNQNPMYCFDNFDFEEKSDCYSASSTSSNDGGYNTTFISKTKDFMKNSCDSTTSVNSQPKNKRKLSQDDKEFDDYVYRKKKSSKKAQKLIDLASTTEADIYEKSPNPNKVGDTHSFDSPIKLTPAPFVIPIEQTIEKVGKNDICTESIPLSESTPQMTPPSLEVSKEYNCLEVSQSTPILDSTNGHSKTESEGEQQKLKYWKTFGDIQTKPNENHCPDMPKLSHQHDVIVNDTSMEPEQTANYMTNVPFPTPPESSSSNNFQSKSYYTSDNQERELATIRYYLEQRDYWTNWTSLQKQGAESRQPEPSEKSREKNKVSIASKVLNYYESLECRNASNKQQN